MKLGYFKTWLISDAEIAALEKTGEGIEAAIQSFESAHGNMYQKQITPKLKVYADVTAFLQISSEMLVVEFTNILDRQPACIPFLNAAMVRIQQYIY